MILVDMTSLLEFVTCYLKLSVCCWLKFDINAEIIMIVLEVFDKEHHII